MRHISKFAGATGYLFLTRGRKVLLTDSRYTTQAKGEAPDFEVMEVSTGRGYGDILVELIRETKTGTLMFEDQHMIYGDVKKLQRKCPHTRWVPAEDRLNHLRMIKTEEELSCIERAEAIGDEAFSRILKDIRPGMTELQIAARLEFYMKEAGATTTSFETIVASGIHSAMPHAVPTEKKIEKGDFVTMDFGCIYKGFCSDMTRTVVVGTANEKQRTIYETVLKAQLAALDVVAAGRTGAEVDEVARKIIREAGYGDYFGHGLGHSVGLYIHEEPRLSPSCHEVLRPGMTETVEPGIYLPGVGGVRIEDLVCITEDGCRNFTHSPKELLEL
jgi:Xaa-Pro aminopeptidase